ncbi:MAG: DsrE family protein [Candidatus Thermoplasmatota archaeon]|jgi:hypothetical protein|nr:DsrE family protein [Candidatus Thermoplasmatota archaeon]
MTKVLYLVLSGEDSPQKFDLAIISGLRSIENKRFEDLKLLFFGPSENMLAKAKGERAENIKKLIEMKAVDSACVAVAKNNGIENDLKLLGVSQEPYGARLAHFLSEGYAVVTF